jgi:signal transduction histidine kinase
MLTDLRLKFRIHHVYYCLAAFDIFLLAISLSVNHSNVKSFEQSIAINSKYVEDSKAAEKLTRLAALTNAPGNDVFDSHNVEKERTRLNIAVSDYKRFFNEVHGKTGLQNLKFQLSQIDSSMEEMLIVANSIFDDFEKNKLTSAGSKMASMDQKFARLNDKLAAYRSALYEMQATDLKTQSLDVHRSSYLENALGVIVVLMVLLVAWFGHVMSEKARHQETALRENSKMIALGEMAGGVAHEINNPLAIVRTKASQLRRLIASDRFEKTQSISFLQEIEDTSIRMSKIVDGLRTFSRSSSNEIKAPIQLSKLLSDVQGLCQERLNNSGVKLEIKVIEDIELNCRAVQIEQVLVNLINNAFDAINGTNAPWISLEVKKTNDKIEVLVTDSGSGIPDKIADKLMQPFFTTKPVGKGTGLGLSISVGIAESHGGSLILNRQSKNTQFILTLPTTAENKSIKKLTA